MKASCNYFAVALAIIGIILCAGCEQNTVPTASEETSLYAAAKRVVKGFQALVAGNPAIPRPSTDSWDNFSLVDMNNPFPADGEVKVWEVYVNTTEPVQLVIYRVTADPSQFSIVGTSERVIPASAGFNQFFLAEPISVQAGDFVGLVNSGTAFTYGGTGSSVRWSSYSGTGLTGYLPGNPRAYGQLDRVYSIKALEGATICHKPGTRAEKTMIVPVDALAGHLGHGDSPGACGQGGVE